MVPHDVMEIPSQRHNGQQSTERTQHQSGARGIGIRVLTRDDMRYGVLVSETRVSSAKIPGLKRKTLKPKPKTRVVMSSLPDKYTPSSYTASSYNSGCRVADFRLSGLDPFILTS